MRKPGTVGGTIGLTLLLIAACGAVSAYSTISYEEGLDLPEPMVEALALRGEEQIAPKSYVREEQFQRADTIAEFIAPLRSLRELRPGTFVSAEVGAAGDLISLTWLSGRDTLVRIAPEGDGYARSESLAPLQTRLGMKSGLGRQPLFGGGDG